jgi:hypothetical protein
MTPGNQKTYTLKRREEIRVAPAAGESQLKGKRADPGQPVRKVRLVTVAEGLSWNEAKRRRNLDLSLEIVPDRLQPAATSVPPGLGAGSAGTTAPDVRVMSPEVI